MKVEELNCKGKNIAIHFSNKDIGYIVTDNIQSIFLDEKLADSLIFHLETILKDRNYRK